ncbi:molybdopterin cofactor-binding domain-containing protein [Qipengyuania sp.]|uniref:xanthine dehydrogenase family protein molybdopterin-binding subunit n=1 Tax=Qipengyuania sp. TaxID=2004515 RepID=UPI003735D8B6
MAERQGVSLPAVSRRRLLVGGAAAGGLLVAWSLWPRSYSAPLMPGEGEAGFGGWLTIGRSGVVTVAIPQLEMGQGVTTVLAQVAAVELGADWRQIAVEPAPPAGLYANLPLAARWAPLWTPWRGGAGTGESLVVERFARGNAFAATAAGTSFAAFEIPLREAAAAARDMLTRAAAARLDVAPEECLVADGLITHAGRALPFGALVDDAAALDPPDVAPLRSTPAREDPLFADAGDAPAFPRLDLPAKIDGSYRFAADIRLPGMLFAAIRHGPWNTPDLRAFDKEAAAGMPGLVRVVKSRRWLAAVATNWWAADRALARMRASFGGPGGVDSARIEALLDAGLDAGEDRSERIVTQGDPDAALETALLRRRYAIAPAVHAPLETGCATARLEGGRLELWAAAQAPEAARQAAAAAVGLSPADVVFYPVGAGGSFDARLEVQHAVEAAQIAAEVGRPVQLTWSRTQDLQATPPRPPVRAELVAAFSGEGEPAALRTRLVMPPTMHEMGRRLFANTTPQSAIADSAGRADALACEGALPPYAIAHVAVEHVPVELPLPTTRMRGGSETYTAFFTESFIDELATEAGRDPFLYRMALLGQAPRLAEVLRRATRLGNWDGGRQGSGQGVALVKMGSDGEDMASGVIACVAEASFADGALSVRRLSAVADIGRIVNLDIARQQIEGGLIFGLALAAGSSASYEGGRPVPRRLGGLNLPRLATTPAIALELVASEGPAFDPGELGVAVAPPAIANALFAATGRRYRSLPLSQDRE